LTSTGANTGGVPPAGGLDRLQSGYPSLELEVLATDIDEASLKRAIKERLLSAAMRLHEALRPGGLLMIGRKELLAPPVLEFFRPLEGLPGFCRKL
jgi:chemotaxis methyl-accepting protein methylase